MLKSWRKRRFRSLFILHFVPESIVICLDLNWGGSSPKPLQSVQRIVETRSRRSTYTAVRRDYQQYSYFSREWSTTDICSRLVRTLCLIGGKGNGYGIDSERREEDSDLMTLWPKELWSEKGWVRGSVTGVTGEVYCLNLYSKTNYRESGCLDPDLKNGALFPETS